MLFSGSGNCIWNTDHELLYVGYLQLETNANGEVEISEGSKLLAAYEVLPDELEVVQKEKKGKKWMTLLEKATSVAERVIMSSGGGMVLK